MSRSRRSSPRGRGCAVSQLGRREEGIHAGRAAQLKGLESKQAEEVSTQGATQRRFTRRGSWNQPLRKGREEGGLDRE